MSEVEGICFEAGGVRMFVLGVVPFERSAKVLMKGKEDKPSTVPVAPMYFKKSRREIFPSELVSVSDG